MKPYRLGLGLCAIAIVMSSAEPAMAAWNNVFQATCFFRNRSAGYAPSRAYYSAPSVAYSAPVVAAPSACNPCCNPCPQTQCTTRYIQRSYYVPVTTYQTKTYYQPVTTYRTSYYYEPVTSYRYSCSYDPCTCSYRRVAVPTTSYLLRSKCCPVKSFVQRCMRVPVTSYRKSCYLEPQTTCCTVDPCANTTIQAPAVAVPQNTEPPTARPVPNVKDNLSNGNNVERYYGTNPEKDPPVNSNSNIQPANPQPPAPIPQFNRTVSKTKTYWTANRKVSATDLQVTSPSSNPNPYFTVNRVNYTSTDSATTTDSLVRGKVVQDGNVPGAGARLMFIHADRKSSREFVTANANGQFEVALTSGQWTIYTHRSNGQPVLHSQIHVGNQKTTNLTVLQR